jgi:hypothetical protein
MDRNNMSPWFKLFALGLVAGVAKELFGPPAPPRVTYNQAVQAVDKVKELRDTSSDEADKA